MPDPESKGSGAKRSAERISHREPRVSRPKTGSSAIISRLSATEIDVYIIKSNQHPSGAYPASPTYSQYPYCWFRDGSFIAHSMDLVGETDSAAAFHRWAARTVLSHQAAIGELVRQGEAREPLDEHDFLPARFTVDGEWQKDGWPNFQLDGYGHWLWSLGQHLRASGKEANDEIKEAAGLIGEYLKVFWQEPCYDAWEEYRSQLHTATLASIYGGLDSLADTLEPRVKPVAQAVRNVILTECVSNGRFVKHIGNTAVDASLLWVSRPFGVVADDNPVMVATAQEIERTLSLGGGVKRYAADTFYGGGEWLLLTAWLGWYHARMGNGERARQCLDWIESHRDADGSLPEQVPGESSNERFLNYWTLRWGPPAKPLLWSHAMALTLRSELQQLTE